MPSGIEETGEEEESERRRGTQLHFTIHLF